jgi:hypothetical protein
MKSPASFYWPRVSTLANSRHIAAFTLAEVMVASSITSLLLVFVIFAVITLHHGYASIEQYAAGQADQVRLLDCLALDLRRGIQLTGTNTCYTVDADGLGMQITVPDLYRFDADDPQHVAPIMIDPTYDAATETAFYNGSGVKVNAGGPYPTKVIAYRFNPADGSITRTDPWAPLTTAPMVVATNLESFPKLTPDPGDISGNTVHYGVTFRSTFRMFSTASNGSEITLRHVTFIRSKNLAH